MRAVIFAHFIVLVANLFVSSPSQDLSPLPHALQSVALYHSATENPRCRSHDLSVVQS